MLRQSQQRSMHTWGKKQSEGGPLEWCLCKLSEINKGSDDLHSACSNRCWESQLSLDLLSVRVTDLLRNKCAVQYSRRNKCYGWNRDFCNRATLSFQSGGTMEGIFIEKQRQRCKALGKKRMNFVLFHWNWYKSKIQLGPGCKGILSILSTLLST